MILMQPMAVAYMKLDNHAGSKGHPLLIYRIEILDLINFHHLSCTRCKGNKGNKHIGLDFLGDSGASLHFTYAKLDFAEYEPMDGSLVQTTNKNSCLQISSKGAVFLSHKIDSNEQITHLYPVFYIPGLHMQLILLGAFLSEGLLLRENKSKLTFFTEHSKKIVMQLHPHMPGQTLF